MTNASRPKSVLRELAPGIGLIVFIVLLFTVIGPAVLRAVGLNATYETSPISVEGTLFLKGPCAPRVSDTDQGRDYQISFAGDWLPTDDFLGLQRVSEEHKVIPGRVAAQGDRVAITGVLSRVTNAPGDTMFCTNTYVTPETLVVVSR